MDLQNETDFLYDLGNNVYIIKRTQRGEYIIRFKDSNGKYKETSWSIFDENLYKDSSIEGAEALQRLKHFLGIKDFTKTSIISENLRPDIP